jgi:hypothetical protein
MQTSLHTSQFAAASSITASPESDAGGVTVASTIASS